MTTLNQFSIARISAKSDVPLRNINDELIVGSHVLWEPNQVVDDSDSRVSIAPIAFAHDFSGPIPSTASFTVTLSFSNKLVESKEELRLYGSIEGIKVIESKESIVPSTSENDIDIVVQVVQPATSVIPFSWSGDFTWTLEKDGVVYGLTQTTRLELYWIAKDIHEIFLGGQPGIPVELLRTVLPNLALSGLDIIDVKSFDPKSATQSTYGNFSKTYDTSRGAPHFGVLGNGGTFNYKYYIAAKPGFGQGSMQPVVNCYDQAAMVQVIQSLGKVVTDRPSWLYLQPCGYILPTKLVGIPGLCNNPFFKSNNSPQIIGVNDTRRTGFGNHAFNGVLATWKPDYDLIYDACGGPQTGVAAQFYIKNVVDKATTLYKAPSRAGTVNDITQYGGVTNSITLLADTQASKGVATVIQKAASVHPHSTSFLQTHWDDVSGWVKSVVGDSSAVAFHHNQFGHGSETVEELWHLAGVDHGGEDGELVLQIKVHTSVSSEGTLDLHTASSAALESLRRELTNTEMDLGEEDEVLDTLWESAPVAQEFAQYAVQLASHISLGQMLIVSGNYFINVYGGSSSASLEPLIRKLLSHTTVNQPISISIPKPSSHRLNVPEGHGGSGALANIVKGVGTPFTVHCQLPHPVSVASAHSKTSGVLLKNHVIDSNDDEGTSRITFEFVTYQIGSHDVELYFARKGTLTGGKKSIQIEVVEGESD